MVSLVVMAAGLGSRFGGTKQLAAVGADNLALRGAVEGAAADRPRILVSAVEHASVRRTELLCPGICLGLIGPHRRSNLVLAAAR